MTQQSNRDRGASRPQAFGPAKPLLSHHTEDHERGWQEPAEAGGGRTAPLREAPRTTIMERLRELVAEGEQRDAGDR
jgi:hypothetical protein